MIETIVTMCLAQAPSGGPTAPAPNPAAFFPFAMMIAVVAFIFLSARSQKKRCPIGFPVLAAPSSSY